MKSKNVFLGISIMWLVIALALSLLMWKDVSLAAKIGLFALGFASGISTSLWLTGRPKQ